jgi:hypothetical protein
MAAATLPGVDCAGGTPAGISTAQLGPILSNTTIVGNPTPVVPVSSLDQLALERVNRARLRPAEEAARYGIALDEGIPGQLGIFPRQPVAMNAPLRAAAAAHSLDMLTRNYFDHTTPEGDSPFARMNQAGYDFVDAGENLAWRGTTGAVDEAVLVENEHADLFVDVDIPGRGHRVTMLNDAFREAGISTIRGGFLHEGKVFDTIMQTQDFATAPDSPTFVLGVVYNDSNANGQYDFGEGTANVTVLMSGLVRSTSAGGGYAFPATRIGSYTISFPNERTLDFTVGEGDRNIKVDFVNGSQIIVNLGLGPLP